MTRIPVSSSNLAAVGYDPTQQALEIEFQNGGVYRYYGVARQSYDELMEAASPGAYFNTSIKRRHVYRRISARSPNLARLHMSV